MKQEESSGREKRSSSKKNKKKIGEFFILLEMSQKLFKKIPKRTVLLSFYTILNFLNPADCMSLISTWGRLVLSALQELENTRTREE